MVQVMGGEEVSVEQTCEESWLVEQEGEGK